MPAGSLRVGEPVRLLDGRTATVVAERVVPGTAAMWDLTVSNVHTFAVGVGQYVVHNICDRGALDTALGGKVDDNLQAQHVIPCECEDHRLVQAAGNLWDQNAARNGELLSSDRALALANDTVRHSGGVAPISWTGESVR